MAYEVEEIKTYKTHVVCDDCGDKVLLSEGRSPLGFDNRMNGALAKGFTFKNYGDGVFKNYCKGCKSKYS